MKIKVRINKVLRRTSGGFHSWCDSNVGIIRKPNNNLDRENENNVEAVIETKLKWYQRLWNWILRKI